MSKQKEQIKSEFPRAINEKSYEYTRIEKLNKNEIENLEDKYENKLNMQQNAFREKEEKNYKQKNKIEDERTYKINNIKEMQDKSYQLQLEQQVKISKSIYASPLLSPTKVIEEILILSKPASRKVIESKE